MPPDERAPSSDNPDPDPAVTAGLDSGGGVAPGDTSPAADSMSGSGNDRSNTPNMGPVSGNRTPMIIALSVLAFFVLAIAIITGASFFPSD
ncbi:MAG: DUF6480 family protein [Frankiaceae bacterium]|nr:DUF6480 family protein [Frankiaceae bacterium]